MERNHLCTGIMAAALLLALVAGLAAAQVPQASPLGTGFTYQGQLSQDGNPVTGTCDFQFGLWDALSDGNPVGSPQSPPPVSVAGGLFTVQLDFGSDAFQGDARWLEIAVCCPTGCDPKVTLIPRQALTPAPYALYSTNADLLDGSHAAAFAPVDHDHWGEAWTGSGQGLSLWSDDRGLGAHASNCAVDAWATSSSARAVRAYADATSGSTVAVDAQVNSPQGTAVLGGATAGSGSATGVYGYSNSPSGRGVTGLAASYDGAAYGVRGVSFSSEGVGVLGEGRYGVEGVTGDMDGRGVYGWGNDYNGANYGVYGESQSHSGTGVYGGATATSGTTYGVYGQSDSSGGSGVYGHATATSGTTYGVHGVSDSSSGTGVYGEATVLGGTTVGVLGKAATGVSWGAAGWNAANGAGVGAWSVNGDLIQAYDGDFPGGSLRFKVDQAGNVYHDGILVPFVALPSPTGGEPEQVSLYGLASTEVWLEDLGSGRLVGGRAEVAIDPVFAQTVALTETYNIYLTATCQEPVLLFVSDKAADHFTVQGVGLDGQPSSCSFDYRLAAKRLGYQDLRLEAVDIPAPVEVQTESQP